jgi:hypothetical protein
MTFCGLRTKFEGCKFRPHDLDRVSVKIFSQWSHRVPHYFPRVRAFGFRVQAIGVPTSSLEANAIPQCQPSMNRSCHLQHLAHQSGVHLVHPSGSSKQLLRALPANEPSLRSSGVFALLASSSSWGRATTAISGVGSNTSQGQTTSAAATI